MTEEEEREEYEYMRMLAQAGGKVDSAPEEEETSLLSKARGAVQSLNKGVFVGYGDEIVGGIKAAMMPESTYDFGEGVSNETQSFADRYAMYRDDERRVTKDFEKEHPKTAFGLNLTGGLVSPANKIAPGFGSGSRVKDVGLALARAAVEGGVAGFGEGEGELSDQLDSAGTGAKWGLGLGIGFRGLGVGIDSTAFKQRIKEPLMKRMKDGTERFQPIHMVDRDGRLGRLYRNLIGRSTGGGKTLGDQEAWMVDEAVDNLKAVRQSLEQEGMDIADEFSSQSGRITKKAAIAQNEVRKQKAQNLVGARRATDEAVETEARRMRHLVARESFPEGVADDVLAGVDVDDIDNTVEAMNNYWNNDAFQEVKNRGFEFDNTLGNKIQERIAGDPDLALQFGDLLPRLQAMQEKLGGGPIPFTELMQGGEVPGFVIDGGALMAMRNLFATGANGSSKSGGALRQIANQFDDFIISNLDDEAADLFKQHISQYTTALTFMDSARAAVGDFGRFNPTQWFTQGRKYAGRGMSDKPMPQRGLARSANSATKAAKEAGKDAKVEVNAQADGQKAAVADGASQEKATLAQARQDAERQLKEQKTYGRGEEAREGVREAHFRATPKGQTGLSEFITDVGIGHIVTPKDTPLIGKLAGSLAATAGLASKPAQMALAGQTQWQRQMAKALRDGDFAKYNRLLSRQGAMMASGE